MSGSLDFSRIAHWIIAGAVFAALLSGFAMTRSDAFSLTLLQAHIAFGAVAGLFSLIRVLSWVARGAPARIYPVSSRVQALASSAVHAALRLVPLALLASGAGMIALSGSFPEITAGTFSGLAVFETLPPRNMHHLAASLLLGLIGLHVTAALWHWRSRIRSVTS